MPTRYWGGAGARDGVRVYDVPGGHSSMLQEPNVRVLATLMQRYLDEGVCHAPTGPVEDRLAVLLDK